MLLKLNELSNKIHLNKELASFQETNVPNNIDEKQQYVTNEPINKEINDNENIEENFDSESINHSVNRFNEQSNEMPIENTSYYLTNENVENTFETEGIIVYTIEPTKVATIQVAESHSNEIDNSEDDYDSDSFDKNSIPEIEEETEYSDDVDVKVEYQSMKSEDSKTTMTENNNTTELEIEIESETDLISVSFKNNSLLEMESKSNYDNKNLQSFDNYSENSINESIGDETEIEYKKSIPKINLDEAHYDIYNDHNYDIVIHQDETNETEQSILSDESLIQTLNISNNNETELQQVIVNVIDDSRFDPTTTTATQIESNNEYIELLNQSNQITEMILNNLLSNNNMITDIMLENTAKLNDKSNETKPESSTSLTSLTSMPSLVTKKSPPIQHTIHDDELDSLYDFDDKHDHHHINNHNSNRDSDNNIETKQVQEVVSKIIPRISHFMIQECAAVLFNKIDFHAISTYLQNPNHQVSSLIKSNKSNVANTID